MSDMMTIAPVFLKDGKESSKNENVDIIINGISESIENEPEIKDIKEEIINELSAFRNYNKLSKKVSIFGPMLIEAEHRTKDEKNKKMLNYMNKFISTIHNNYEEIRDGEFENLPKDYKELLYKAVGFTFDDSCLMINGDFNNGLFRSMWSYYKESINFEHVCFAVACVLSGAVQTKDNRLLNTFLYFLKIYNNNEHKLIMKYFMYHCLMLIRVFYTRNTEEKDFKKLRVFNPSKYMTNLKFGTFKDSNVELYGDIRLSYKENDFSSLLSFAPRSSTEELENNDTLWINWNMMSDLIKRLTKNAYEVLNKTFVALEKKRPLFNNLFELFKFMTNLDIIPRFESAMDDYKNKYKRCYISGELNMCDVLKELKDYIKELNIDSFVENTRFENYKIGITYKKVLNKGSVIERTKVVSELLNINYSSLLSTLKHVDLHKDTTDLTTEDYIVLTTYDEAGHIVREEKTKRN